jgi:hypothetical protein
MSVLVLGHHYKSSASRASFEALRLKLYGGWGATAKVGQMRASVNVKQLNSRIIRRAGYTYRDSGDRLWVIGYHDTRRIKSMTQVGSW